MSTPDGSGAGRGSGWLAAPALQPASLVLALAAGELLAWWALGREQDGAPILALALAWGAVAAGLWWLGRRVVPELGLTVALLGLGLLPFLLHGLDKLDLDGAPRIGAALALAAVGGGVLAGLGRAPLWRVTTAVAALLVAGVAGVAVLRATRDVEDAQRAPAGRHPDVVLIVMDTTRRDRLSLYGHDRPTTPALERLAERGRVYDDAWSLAPWTPPSHATLFTGLLPAEHGVRGERVPPFPEDVASLPGTLRSAGYRTAGFVANPNLFGRGWSRGFDVYAPPWFEGPHTFVAWLNRLLTGGRPAWLDDGTTERVLDRARRWWRRHDDAPRFLFLNLIDPHDPYHPPEPERARFLPELSREEALAVPQDPRSYAVSPGVPPEARRVIAALYDAEIAGLDRRLGDFFDWLAARGELDRSLVVVTSDHGERLGERGMLGHLLRMDQHLLRVPLLLRFPLRVEPGRVAERVQLDAVPGEILALAGVEAPGRLGARRLERAADPATGGAGAEGARTAGPLAVAQHGPFGWYTAQLRGLRADFEDPAATGHWALVADREHALLWSPDRAEEPGWLVALEGDPSWEQNLWARSPATRERLLEVARALPRYPASPGSADRGDGEIDEVLLERLRALGYAD